MQQLDETGRDIEQIQTKYTTFTSEKRIYEEKKDIIQQAAQSQGNFFCRIFNKVKKIFNKSKTKMLTEGTAKSKLQMKDLVFKLNKAKI